VSTVAAHAISMQNGRAPSGGAGTARLGGVGSGCVVVF
jgi:hypothetical protein